MTGAHFDLSDPDAALFCPRCGAGYTARAQQCVDCGADLVPRSWIEAQEYEKEQEREASSRGSTVPLCRVNNRLMANLLESQLEEAGVAFFVKEAGVQPGLRQQALSGHFEFVVMEKDLEKARGILLHLEEGAGDGEWLPDEEEGEGKSRK